MLVSGVVLSAGAVATLARRLHRAGLIRLADDVGLALDADRSELRLAPNEQDAILVVLADCPTPLLPLQTALRAHVLRGGG